MRNSRQLAITSNKCYKMTNCSFPINCQSVLTIDAKRSSKALNGFIHLQGKDLNRDDVNKIYFILSSYQDHLDSTNEKLKPNNQYWDGKGELALFGVLSPEDITKKAAIKVLLKHLNADQKDTISFGVAKSMQL